jgi:ABC-2 type transport system ATP-binding protein
MNSNCIEIRGLTKTFRKFKLGPLNLTVPQGAIYGFIGPNGAGKTTTIDLMLGMGAEEGGTITVLGKDHRREAVEMKQQVGYVSPELNFGTWRKVGNAIRFVKGFYPGWDDAYCMHLLEVFKLSLSDSISTLSFGSKIKLSLLLALAHKPALLILDEPTVGLDAVTKQDLFSQLLALVEDGNHTVFISSHSLADIERFADHVGMIKDGKLIIEGSTDEIISRYRIVDFVRNSGGRMESLPGVQILAEASGKYRALVDRQKWLEEAGQKLGLQEISASPVTLEELFVSLAKN